MTTVLYHSDNDGFGAAYAAWARLGDSATYIPVQYGQPVPELPVGTTKLYILDFSYSRDIIDDLRTRYEVRILDHHKTAQAALAGLACATFDMTKSGARLAWEHFWPKDTEIPEILRYVEDYDLWKFELPESVEVNLYLSSLPWDFSVWAQNAFIPESARVAGRAIAAFREGQIKGSLRSTRKMIFRIGESEYVVPVVNSSANISELGNVLCKEYPEAPFSVSYCDRIDSRSWSLRSIGDFDVSVIAKHFGGGGHRNAAGFSTPIGWMEEDSPAFLAAFESEV